MKSGPLNSFLDFNRDGKIDAAENFMGYMMFQEIFKDEEDEANMEKDDEAGKGFGG